MMFAVVVSVQIHGHTERRTPKRLGALLTLLVAALASPAHAQTLTEGSVIGSVVDTFIGEIDGHATCITYVQPDRASFERRSLNDSLGDSLGIVEPAHACAAATRFSESSGHPRVRLDRLEPVASEIGRRLSRYRTAGYMAGEIVDLEPRGPGLYAKITSTVDNGEACRFAAVSETDGQSLEIQAASGGCPAFMKPGARAFIPQAATTELGTGRLSISSTSFLIHREPHGAGLYGQVDERFVGDLNGSPQCITYVESLETPEGWSQGSYALVSPTGHCTSDLISGASVFVPIHALTQLTESENLTSFQEYRVATYYKYEFLDERIGGSLWVSANPLPLDAERFTALKPAAEMGRMKVESHAAEPFSPEELRAVLAEGQRLYGDACDGVPVDAPNFHGPIDLSSMFHYLEERAPTWTSPIDAPSLSRMRAFLESDGAEKWRVFYGEETGHQCGRLQESSYHLVWNTETNEVFYLVLHPYRSAAPRPARRSRHRRARSHRRG